MFQKEFILIDTAGIRRKNKEKDDLEFYSVIRAIKAMDEADVCLMVIDAVKGITAQDLSIFSLAAKKGKGIVFLVNKWDLVPKETNTARDYEKRLKDKLAPFTDVPILFISAVEKTRIFKAIEMDQPEVVSNLLARGFDPNSPSPKNVPALILSYQKKSMKVLDILIDSKKTNLNVISADGETLLMLAAINNQLSLADRLISKGADVNKPGWTALHYAASKGHIEMIRLLLDQQAYLDAESPNGTTPLMMAASYGSAMSVKLLLEEGADPRIKNKLGLTALDMAKQPEKEDAKRYLLAFTTAWNQKYSPQAVQQAARELAAMREKERKEEAVVEEPTLAVEEKMAEPPVEL
jgi:small GTP-binding protein